MASLASDYLHLAQQAIDLIGTPAVERHWTHPSALADYTVGGLAGHLARGIVTVATYLDHPAPVGAEAVDAVEYYVRALADHDPIDSDMHRNVRIRSTELAAAGPVALTTELHELVVALAPRLHATPDTATVVVFGSLAVTLHEYLITRVVELAVHLDDLATSVGTAPPPVPEQAGIVIVAMLAELARRRCGTHETLRLLARRERVAAATTAI